MRGRRVGAQISVGQIVEASLAAAATCLLLLAVYAVGHAVLHGERVGQVGTGTTLTEQARPLPSFIDSTLGAPRSTLPSDASTQYSTQLGTPFLAVRGASDGGSVGFSMLDAPAGAARHDYEHGVRFSVGAYDVVQDRRTSLLREQVVVHERQGVRTWSWQLTSRGTPTEAGDGSVRLAGGARLLPPRIYDRSGATLDIPGLAWVLRGHQLSLTVDDRKLALPYVIDPDTTAPVIQIESIDATHPCVAPKDQNAVWVRTHGCEGSFDVRVRAYDVWQDDISESNTSGLGPGATSSSYGVQWGPVSMFNSASAGAVNWPTAPFDQSGHPMGLRTTCWDNQTLTGIPDGSGIDNKLDYSGEQSIPGLNQSSTDDPLIPGDPFAPASRLMPLPPDSAPYSNNMSCRWSGFVTARSELGNYVFKAFSDDSIRVDVGPPYGPLLPPFESCAGGAPLICDWTPHAFVWSVPSPPVMFAPREARPISVIWREGGGLAATGLVWDPPAPTSFVNSPDGGASQVVPASNFVTDIHYAHRYDFTSDLGDPATGSTAVAVSAQDVAINTSPSTNFNVALDNTPPAPASSVSATTSPDWSAQAGWTNDTTISLAKLDGIENESGVESVKIQFRYALSDPSANGCGTPQTLVELNGTGFTYDTAATQTYVTPGLADGCYFYQYVVTDRVGNVTINPMVAGSDINDPATWIKIDTQVPVITPASQSITQGAGSVAHLYWPGTGSEAWFNPTVAGTAHLGVGVTDGGRGVDRVEFPDPDGAATMWSSPALTDHTDRKTMPYQTVLNWSVGATSTGLMNARAWDLMGNGPTDAGFTLTADATPPTGGTLQTLRGPGCTIAMSDGQYVDGDVCLQGAGPITDAGSGVDPARTVLQRRSSPLSSGVCGTLPGWSDLVIAPDPATPYIDPNTLSGNCYEYRYVVTDRVGNQHYVANGVVVRKDTTAPTGTINTAPVGPVSGSVTFTGTAEDGMSGVSTFDLTYAGPENGSACSGQTLSGGSSWACNWAASVPDGSYLITLVVRDVAGNTSAAFTRTIVVDAQPPVTTVSSIVEGANVGFQHTRGGRHWFNPARSGSFTVHATVADGVGARQAHFPTLGNLWSPGDVDSAAPFSHSYSWTADAADPGTHSVTGEDYAGNTSTAAFTVSADFTLPSAGTISSSSGVVNVPSVSFGIGDDLQSGIAGWQMQRRSTSTLSATTCDPANWTAFSDIGPGSPASPFNDTAVARSTCYEYQLLVTDQVGNVRTYASPSTAITDTPGLQLVESGGSTTVTEGGSTDTVSVVLATAPTANVAVAITGSSQIVVPTSSLTFTPANWSTPQTVNVAAFNDAIDEVSPTSATLTFDPASSDAEYNSLANANVTVSITDDDSSGVLVSPVTGLAVTEGSGAAGTYQVRLMSQPVGTVTVLPTQDGQVAATPNVINFNASNWSIPVTVTVTANDDPDLEGPHGGMVTHAVSSTDPSYASATGASVAVTIADNETATLITTASAVPEVDEANGADVEQVTVRLASRPSGSVMVMAAGLAGQLVPSPATITFTPTSWNVPQTVDVIAADDNSAESTPHIAKIGLSASSTTQPRWAVDGTSLVSMNVRDNDAAAISIRPPASVERTADGAIALTEGAAAGTGVTLGMRAGGDPMSDVTITPRSMPRGQLVFVPASITIPAGTHDRTFSFTVRAADDEQQEEPIGEVTASFVVTTDDAVYGAVVPASIRFGITDNDQPRTTQETTQQPPTNTTGGTGGSTTPPPTDTTPTDTTGTEATPTGPEPTTTDESSADETPPAPDATKEEGAGAGEKDEAAADEKTELASGVKGAVNRTKQWAKEHTKTAAATATASATVAGAVAAKVAGGAAAKGIGGSLLGEPSNMARRVLQQLSPTGSESPNRPGSRVVRKVWRRVRRGGAQAELPQRPSIRRPLENLLRDPNPGFELDLDAGLNSDAGFDLDLDSDAGRDAGFRIDLDDVA